MIKDIRVLSRRAIEETIQSLGQNFPYKKWHLISIYGGWDDVLLTPDSKAIMMHFGLQDGISLNFWDITPSSYTRIKKRYPEAILFHQTLAKIIVDFIEQLHKSEEDTNLIIHCTAGISRSGAVGTFASDYIGNSYDDFISDNPYVMANPYVLRILKRVSGIVPDFGSYDKVHATKHRAF